MSRNMFQEYPDIIQELHKAGFTLECPRKELEDRLFIRGITRPVTQRRHIEMMDKFKFIKANGNIIRVGGFEDGS